MPRFAAALALLLLTAVLATAPAAGPATAQDEPGGDAPGSGETYDGAGLTGLSEPTYEESVTEVYQVPTDHGTVYGEVIRPVVPDGVTVPVILTYSPYNVIGQAVTGNGSIAADATADYYVTRGYARAVFDVIGTRNSGGCYDYGGLGERETGAAVVDFLGAQDWANGRVGMIGGSYDGTTQWAAAIEQPEHLTTIVPQVAIDRWYDYAFGGGIRYFLNNENPADEGFDTPLAFDFGFGLLPSPDPARQGPELFVESLQGSFNPCERIQHTERAYEFDPVYDEFWEERDYHRHAEQITASVMVEGGWLDHNVKHWDSTRMFMALPEDLPRHLVMGQWAHAGNQHEDAEDLRHAWFDHWLLDLDTGIDVLPLVDTQTGGTDERLADVAWPPATTTEAVVPLEAPVVDATDRATDRTADRGTSTETQQDPPTNDEGGDATTSDTALVLVGAEVPTWGEQEPPTTEEEIFSSQSSARGTYIHYLTTEPVAEDVRIAGSPTVTLEVTTDGGSTHFTPVLYEQAEDGTTSVITRGFLNARNRNGLDVSEPVVPGEPYTAAVEMWDVDHTVTAGNRIGLALASGNADWVLPDDDQQGTNTLGPSSITLPVSAGHEQLGVTPPDPGEDVDGDVGEDVDGIVDRLAGAGRVETAVAVSADTFESADAVVVATAEDYPDALAAGPLAAALDAPLLLTGRRGLAAAVAAEVDRLGASRAVLVGGTAALSAQVAEDLQAQGLTVERADGATRFATAAAVAERVAAAGDATAITPLVVEGDDPDPARGWPDAVSAGALGASTGQPILLVTTETLPADTAEALESLGAAAATIVGGSEAVSATVQLAIEERGVTTDRVAGPTRYATSAAVHARLVESGADPSTTWVATGRNWPDALTAGPAVAATSGAFLLVDGQDLDRSPETRDLLDADVARARLLGGPAAISEEVRQVIEARLAE